MDFRRRRENEKQTVMAKIEQGILGPFHGTVGTVIGYRWRDRWCMRARPSHYNDRRSEAQLQQRSRFKAMIQFASPATPLLRLGLKAWATEHSLTEGNAFLRLNHECFASMASITSLTSTTSMTSTTSTTSMTSATGNIDYPRLRFSHGTLPPIQKAEARRVDATTVSVGWERGYGGEMFTDALPRRLADDYTALMPMFRFLREVYNNVLIERAGR